MRDGAGAGGDAGGGGATGATDGEAAAPAPPPPTTAEAFALCPSPSPAGLGVNPEQRGLTGLETFLWAAPSGPLSTSGTIRGYAVGCRLEPLRWTFTTGDGSTYTTHEAGGPAPDHVVAHVYDARNEPGEDHTLSLTVTWRRTTNLGNDTVTSSESRPYHVVEVRSVPDAPGH